MDENQGKCLAAGRVGAILSERTRIRAITTQLVGWG